MKKSGLLLVVLIVSGWSALSAQDLPATGKPIVFGRSAVALTGPWKFHIGDDPQWADPSYDDSGWETVDLTPRPGVADPFTGDPHYVPGWTTRGHAGYWGYAWYRIRVAAAAGPGEKLAVMADGVDDGYQVFAQGQLLGSNGEFRAGKYPVVYFPQPAMFVLPGAPALSASGPQPQVLAFRVWMGPVRLSHHTFTGGMHYAPLLGESGAIAEQTHIAWLELVRHYAFSGLLCGVFLLLTLVAASLILFDRSDRVYLWVAAAILLATIREIAFSLANWTHLVSIREFFIFLEGFLLPLSISLWAMVWWIWFQLRRPSWIPPAIAALTGLDMVCELAGENVFYGISPSLSLVAHAASGAVRLGLVALLVYIVARGIREQGKEGWLVLPAAVLMLFAQFQSELISLRLHGTFIVFGTIVFYTEAAELALAAAIALLLLRRLLLSLGRQRQMALDIKQAQELQQVLIPRERPPIPGLEIETEYRPAREVGGDFFQIVEHPSDGSVLIVAGDVAGKGLKAGMMVALLVGAIRTATDASFDPGFVLDVLNRRLQRRGDSQATCLALRIGKNGEATLANAGHLAPYLNGEPVGMEGALPLGLMEGAEFPVRDFQLGEGDRLVLMSDGIAEAMDERRELFGFERVDALLRTGPTAAEVAETAERWGQEDDITVLSITLTARMEAVVV
ncbi:MAG TPA: SpoIIE family protein phosphatase [Acidobacteriaceae bacterium]